MFTKYQPFTQSEELFRFVYALMLVFFSLMCLTVKFYLNEYSILFSSIRVKVVGVGFASLRILMLVQGSPIFLYTSCTSYCCLTMINSMLFAVS